MNIMENKRVAAIAALMAIAYVGICYKGYERYAVLKANQQQIDNQKETLESFALSSMPPTEKNRKRYEQAVKDVKKLREEIHSDFAKYEKFCTQGQSASGDDAELAYKPGATPLEFRKRLQSLSDQIVKQATDSGRTEIKGEARKMGLSGYIGQSATAEEAPYLNFLLSAVYRLEQHLIDSGASTVNFVYCAPLPEIVKSRKKAAEIPLSFEVSFTARRGTDIKAGDESSYSVVPQVINRVVKDKDFFYTITGMAVSTSAPLPMVGNSSARTSAPADGEDSEEAASEEQKAALIIGKDDETVYVHLNMQVLFFGAEDQSDNKKQQPEEEDESDETE